jgi:hypothetical protein
MSAGLVIASMVSGCGSQPQGPKDRALVSGVVTLDGQPLPGGIINFHSTERSVGTTVLIKSEGVYKSDRVPLGQNVVTIDTASMQIGGGAYVAIPAKYNDPTKSGLVIDVKAGSNEDVNFSLQK